MAIATIAWNKQNVIRLRARWADGFSARQIGDELGCSRSAVMGKIHRLGLTREIHPSSRPRKAESTHHQRAARMVSTKKKSAPVTPPTERMAGNKTLIDLGEHDCHWPVDDPPRLFCAAERIPGRPYCGEHCRIGGMRYRH